MNFSWKQWAVLGQTLTASGSLFAAALEPAQLDFFENKIRPILVDSCYECHSTQGKKSKGGLLLDTREGLLKGGEAGPAIVPGDPGKSLLIRAVGYAEKDLQMPPKNKKLSDEKIAALTEWVKMGAPDPRTGSASVPTSEGITKVAQAHWAFQPVTKPPLPAVRNANWVQTPVDAFILAKLEGRGLRPSTRADKRTLIRRASFGLTGLPPTPEELAEFERDETPEAFARVVDRLLASPRYGERWARHWLDVARYADTKGYVFQEERRYPYAYTYRDYVVRAFNEDLPYDRFIVEQLAADLLPLGEDKRPLAAMGFLTLGRRFLNNQPDIIDDRIDVTMRGFQGLTVPCARCHDHKFDPIPTKDYYSLYGVFASSVEPGEKPLLGAAALPAAYPEYLAEFNKRETERAEFVRAKEQETLATLREKSGEYLLTAFEGKALNDDSKTESLAKERKLDFGVVRRWMNSLEAWKKTNPHPVFAPWFELGAVPTAEWETKVPPMVAAFHRNETSTPLNPAVAKALGGEAPKSMQELAQRYGGLFKEIEQEWMGAMKSQAAKPERLDDANRELLRQVLYAPDAPANLPAGEIPRLWDVPTAEKSRALKRKVEELEATHPGAPPRAMAMVDSMSPQNAKVFIRGSAQNPGPEVPRQFLEIIAGAGRKPFQKGSGRLEMAEAIASRENPLTARVFVNRVWLQHFGSALVRTPSDFGLRTEAPANPELLDYLAWQFMQDGWSVKKLHRLILLSSVYQQSSEINPEYARIDSANELLWRMNRRRLEFEPMRDTLLAVAGALNTKAGGHPQDLLARPFETRRTIYGFIDRQNLPGMFRTFDLASPDATSPQRFSTTVPQQALFMINGPFAIEQARHLLERPEIKAAHQPAEKIRRLYELAFQRPPDKDEMDLALGFVAEQNGARPQLDLTPAWSYGYGVFDTNRGRLTGFTEFPTFQDETWKGGAKVPAEKTGWALLNARGGHPGEEYAAIRRWKAPRDGLISIKGTLGHEPKEGDGVRGRILLNEDRELGMWLARNEKTETGVAEVRVRKGDQLFFSVDKFGDTNSDTFTWAPIIQMAGAESPTLAVREWNAREDYSGPKEIPKPLEAWEKLAQVVLMANELVFVD